MRFRNLTARLIMLPGVLTLALLTPATAFAGGSDRTSRSNWEWFGHAVVIFAVAVIFIGVMAIIIYDWLRQRRNDKRNRR